MELRIEYDDLEHVGFDAGGTEMLHYQGQPFTGILESRTNGKLYGEEEYQNGYRQGIQREFFFPSGNLQMEYSLINNGLEGVFKEFDEQGNLVSQTNWHKGEQII